MFVLVKVAILILGLFWSKEIFARLPHDLRELKNNKDGTTRFVIVLFWVITAVYLLFAITFIWGLVWRILHPPV